MMRVILDWLLGRRNGCEHDWEDIEKPSTFEWELASENHRRRMSGKSPNQVLPCPTPEPRPVSMVPRYKHNRVCLKCGAVDDSLTQARIAAAETVNAEEWRRQEANRIWEERT